MALPQIVPPRDLLEQVEGVESGLRRGQRATLAGVLVAAVQATFLIANSQWLESLLTGDWSYVLDNWWLLLSLFVFVLAVIVAGWARFWLRESRQPFRYTYSIAPFQPLDGSKEEPILVPLHADVRERLSERIARLSLLEGGSAEPAPEAPAEGVAEAQPDSHIHVSGTYAVRTRPPDPRWFVEITPWVHVGGTDRAAKLATPVRYALEERAAGTEPPSPSAEEYEHILERTYFTIATAIYRQIELDVDRKIALLPRRWFQATALFHEAEDYARSNTLDAYETARRLYWDAIRLYDPTWEPLPRARVRRLRAKLRKASVARRCRMRRRLSSLIPRLGRAEVLIARAEIGYANAMLDTGALASLAGLRGRAGFAAAPIADDARARLEALDEDVPRRSDSLFDALVCVAQTQTWLSNEDVGSAALERAQAIDPRRAEDHPRYLYARAALQPRLEASITGYRSAVEHSDRFELAMFDFAYATEMLWRTRPKLEPSVADTVRDCYADVLKVNPSSLAAWANRGYVAWLVGGEKNLDAARRCFDTGRRFKEITRKTNVAELDHGLARIAAETGNFDRAYAHYVDAVSTRISQGGLQAGYLEYHFELIGAEILKRFKSYSANVAEHHRNPDPDQLEKTTARIRTSVYAFALTDYGEACYRYYLATGDRTELDNAYKALSKATQLNPRFVVPWLALSGVERERQIFEPGAERPFAHLETVESLAPEWDEAAPLLMSWHSTRARELKESAESKRDEAGRAAAAETSEPPTRDLFGPSFEAAFPDTATAGPSAAALAVEAAKLDEEAAQHRQRAEELPRMLIPHRWLWKTEPDGHGWFQWDVLDDDDADYPLRWQRSFELPHVWALVSWCDVMAEDQDCPERLDDLLDLIQERFLPNDLNLLDLRRRRARQLAEVEPGTGQPMLDTYEERIARKVRRALDANPGSYVDITWVQERNTHSAPQLEKLAKMDGLSGFTYAWVGGELLERFTTFGEEYARVLAEAAFDKAMTAGHARTLLDVGDGLARLDREAKAVEAYTKGAGRAREPYVMTALAERLEEHGDEERALELNTRARSRDTGPEPRHGPEYYAFAIGRLQWRAGKRDEALAELGRIPSAGGELGSAWRTQVITRLREVGGVDADAYLRLRTWLAAGYWTALGSDDDAVSDCAAAARELAGGYEEIELPGKTAPEELGLPFATPIRLDASAVFYPQGEATPAVSQMIDVSIPALREEIRSLTGVILPGIRLRSDESLPEREYRILVMDVPVAAGTVPPDVADPYGFMLARVGEAVRPRLPGFVDMQALETMLAGPGVDPWLVQTALPSEAARRRFLALVKSLVSDEVPVNDLSVPLRVFAGADTANGDAGGLVGVVRHDLQQQLIGRDAPRAELPPPIEEWIGAALARSGGSLSELGADEVRSIREAIRSIAAGNGQEVALVTSEQLRPAVRELVGSDLPLAHVFSREELGAHPEPAE